MFTSKLKHFLILTTCLAAFQNAFANEAPVYDVDSYPPQFDEQTENAPAPRPEVIPKAPVTVDQPAAADTQPMFVPDTSLSTEQRVARLEGQITNMLNASTAAKVDAMQNDVATLRGQLEELTHQVQQMQEQQKTLYADLDKRVRKPVDLSEPISETPKTEADDTIPAATKNKLKMAPAANLDKASKAGSTDAAQPNVAEEQNMYQSAYTLIKNKKYSQAASTLQKMLQKYPSGQFAANAHYWLGELYGLLGKNDQAVTEFGTVVKNYPESSKLADAQLKLGLIYAAQFKWTDAKSAFRLVINHYPGTPSARLASEQLKQIKQAGH
jgi:tol-pal system protein YbgF